MSKSETPISFATHNHAQCIDSVVSLVEKTCAEQSLKFTPVRRRTLEILLKEHRAMGAYEILAQLKEDGFGAQPPVAYRALDFLTSNGFVHKVEKLNAFVACLHPAAHHTPAFLICTSCGKVAETETDQNSNRLAKIAAQTGFKIENAVIEAEGICPNCHEVTPGS